MALGADSPKYSLDIVLPKLGLVLKSLFEEEQKKKPGAIPFTNKQLVLALIGFLLALPLLYFLLQTLALLGHPSPLLTNLASIAEIISVIIPLGVALVGTLIALFKKSSK